MEARVGGVVDAGEHLLHMLATGDVIEAWGVARFRRWRNERQEGALAGVADEGWGEQWGTG